jgi:hypothetical protein
MKTCSSHIYRLRRKKEVAYSNYYFAMALYAIYKKESRKEAKLPASDFRNGDLQKERSALRLKKRLGRYILAITTVITSSFFFGKKKPVIIKLHNTSEE